MAGVAGLEPVTSAVTGQRSNQLSYTPRSGTTTLPNPDSLVKATIALFGQHADLLRPRFQTCALVRIHP
jgi:hypothetical protein